MSAVTVRKTQAVRETVFVLFPFSEIYNVYEQILKAARSIPDRPFLCLRANRRNADLAGTVIGSAALLKRCDFIIIDTTGKGKYCFDEIALARRLGKRRVVLITQDELRLPPRCRDVIYFQYSVVDYPGLRQNLREALQYVSDIKSMVAKGMIGFQKSSTL